MDHHYSRNGARHSGPVQSGSGEPVVGVDGWRSGLGGGAVVVVVVVGGCSNKPSSQRPPPHFAAIFSSGAAEAGVPSA